MAERVADVVGKRANGEGQLVGVGCIAEKADNEVAGADVVRQVGISHIAEGVIADVLNDATAVRVGASLVELRRGQVRIAAEQ